LTDHKSRKDGLWYFSDINNHLQSPEAGLGQPPTVQGTPVVTTEPVQSEPLSDQEHKDFLRLEKRFDKAQEPFMFW